MPNNLERQFQPKEVIWQFDNNSLDLSQRKYYEAPKNTFKNTQTSDGVSLATYLLHSRDFTDDCLFICRVSAIIPT